MSDEQVLAIVRAMAWVAAIILLTVMVVAISG